MMVTLEEEKAAAAEEEEEEEEEEKEEEAAAAVGPHLTQTRVLAGGRGLEAALERVCGQRHDPVEYA